MILLEGAIGCGKTTLGVEFIYHGAREFDEPGLIVVFEVSPDKLARNGNRVIAKQHIRAPRRLSGKFRF